MAYCVDEIGFSASSRPKPSLRLKFRNMLSGWFIRREAFNDLNRLSPRYLQDIGIGRGDIASVVDREIGRMGLDEFRSRG